MIKYVLVDADTLVYMAGYVADKDKAENSLHTSEFAHQILDNIINNLFQNMNQHLKQDFYPLSDVKNGTVKFFLTANDKSNFRFNVAKTKPYKGNRKDVIKPTYYDAFREHLQVKYRALTASGYEADDAICIEAAKRRPEEVMILAEDKDLRQFPCWHYWYKGSDKYPRPPYYVDGKTYGLLQLEKRMGAYNVYATGDYSIAYQMLVGDTSDNIPGIEKGYGPKKAYDLLSQCAWFGAMMDPLVMVRHEYTRIHGEYEGAKRYAEILQLVSLLDLEPIDAN